MSYERGGYVPSEPTRIVNRHPWKCEPIVPLKPTPEQIEHAASIVAFQEEIDLIDTSALDEM